MEIKKDKFTKEFRTIYFRHKENEFVKSTPQVIEEIMQEKAKKQLENMEVEDFLIDEIIENRKNTFTETDGTKIGKGKKNGEKENSKDEYKKFFIEFPKIYPTATNLRFNDLYGSSKKPNKSNNILNDSALDKSKIINGLRSNHQIHRFNTKLKSVEDIIKRSPILKKNAKSLMNNFYTTSDKKVSEIKAIKSNLGMNSFMNKTSMISDVLTTNHTTIAFTDENNLTARKLNNSKFTINPDYIKQIHNISNDKTINHLLNVIEHQNKVKNVIDRIVYVEKNIIETKKKSEKVMDFYEKKSNDIKKKYKNIVYQNFPDLF